jgi:hypothetical protein
MEIINNQELKELLNNKEITQQEMLMCIRKYIFDRKGQDVGVIAHPVNAVHEHLCDIAYRYVIDYYKDKEL